MPFATSIPQRRYGSPVPSQTILLSLDPVPGHPDRDARRLCPQRLMGCTAEATARSLAFGGSSLY
jgi:hypothetical protein